jgi:hypothetical protein
LCKKIRSNAPKEERRKKKEENSEFNDLKDMYTSSEGHLIKKKKVVRVMIKKVTTMVWFG